MGEVKNAFIKSKMNKDLEARLVPSGEYRNAVNAQVSKSEGSSVGSLENVLGNDLVVNFSTLTEENNLISIGTIANELDNTIYMFLTDNTGGDYVTTANNFVIYYNTLTNEQGVLLSGPFLNFSTLNKIYGVNILEGLLFWTDNRNQPRKINISKAVNSSTYYSTEDQISVAKYNPYQSIEFYKESVLDAGEYETTLYDVVSKFYPGGGTGVVGTALVSPSSNVQVNESTINGNLAIGDTIAYVNPATNLLVNTGATVETINSTTIGCSVNVGPFLIDQELIFNFNPYYDPTYNGDPNFLEDKFVRFAYRYQFEDGEYSIFSPFSQTAFMPKQDGYFMYNQPAPNPYNIDVDDESAAYRSTIVEFMENKVNKTLLVIPLPFTKTQMSSDGSNPLKIISIDILYKESDALAVKVIETIDMRIVKADAIGDDKNYVYNYQSKKPYKTLPSDELIRVYDKIPVKAFGQEIISNRIVYSNFQNKHTPPATLDYNLLISEKSNFNLNISTLTTTSLTENTVTINSTIATGSVIIGGIVTGAGVTAGTKVVSFTGTLLETDTIQVSIASGATLTVKPASSDINTTSSIEYPNHSLKQNRNYQVGIVLSDRFGRTSSVILSNSLTSVPIGGVNYLGSTIYSPYRSSSISSYNWAGDSLKVLFNDTIGTKTDQINNANEPGVYNGDPISPLYNPLGWYSYKVVVKQTEQEYYNVYLPGVLAAYPSSATLEIGKTSFASLLGDNINKVPRDLSEVGPQQKQFRSSVKLFGRVENNNLALPHANSQYFPTRFSSTVSAIATNSDLFNGDGATGYTPSPDFYEIESNPLISKISTNKKFGVNTTDWNQFGLAVLETAPVESNLDIFWETSTSGVVADLNSLILNESNGASSFGNWSTGSFTEAVAAPQSITGANGFSVLDNFGTAIPLAGSGVILKSVTLTSVRTREDTPEEVFAVANPRFTLVEDAATSTYKVNTVTPSGNNFNWVYGINGVQNKSFIFYFTVVTETVATGVTFSSQIIEYAALGNINPSLVTYNGTGSCPGAQAIGTTGDVDIATVYGTNGSNTSQNAPSLGYLGIYEGLSFNISTVDSSGNAVTPGFIQTTSNWNSASPLVPFGSVISKPASFNVPGTYTATLVLSDAGPATVTCIFNVVVTEDGCITVSRTSSNIYGGGATLSYTDCSGNPAVETWCGACCGDTRQISYLNGSPVPGQPSGGNTCCFTKGDEVEMFDGSFKDISAIKIGDEVKSNKNNKIAKGIVTKALKHLVNDNAKVIKINGITGEHNHPVFIDNKWIALKSQGEVSEEYITNFYNLEVDGDKENSEHNYIIGGLIVSGLGDNAKLNALHKRQPIELTSHLK